MSRKLRPPWRAAIAAGIEMRVGLAGSRINRGIEGISTSRPMPPALRRVRWRL
jgi:hypothetical protein